MSYFLKKATVTLILVFMAALVFWQYTTTTKPSNNSEPIPKILLGD